MNVDVLAKEQALIGQTVSILANVGVIAPSSILGSLTGKLKNV